MPRRSYNRAESFMEGALVFRFRCFMIRGFVLRPAMCQAFTTAAMNGVVDWVVLAWGLLPLCLALTAVDFMAGCRAGMVNRSGPSTMLGGVLVFPQCRYLVSAALPPRLLNRLVKVVEQMVPHTSRRVSPFPLTVPQQDNFHLVWVFPLAPGNCFMGIICGGVLQDRLNL